MKKKSIIIVSVVGVGTLAILVTAGLIFPTEQGKYIAKNCPNYHYSPGFVGPRSEFIDCKNNIGIEKYSDEDSLTVFNGLFYSLENWDSFQIHSYKIVDDKMYYIEDPAINNGRASYFSVTQWPDQVKSLSLFRIIDTNTTEIALYKTLAAVPANERPIFQELQ